MKEKKLLSFNYVGGDPVPNSQNLLETIITDRHRLSSTVLFYSVP